MNDLQRAWRWREERGVFSETQAVRVFYGPGEGSGAWRSWAVDRFGEHYWVTQWEAKGAPAGKAGASAKGGSPVSQGDEKIVAEIVSFLRERGARSVVWLARPEQGVPAVPRCVFGEAPQGRFEVSERGARFCIQLLDTRHPGLFLDHSPLREWLRARSRGWKVLNTFSYTGSLSVAAGLGGAEHVTTLDLSKPTIQWAEENWRLNGLSADRGRFIYGDVFEWLPRLKRDGQSFDCIVLDPPSFSRGHKGNFSTSKDLQRLHELALALLAPGGVMVTSINSENVTWAKYENEVFSAARAQGVELDVLWRVDLPETFPTPLGRPDERYLKGWALRARS